MFVMILIIAFIILGSYSFIRILKFLLTTKNKKSLCLFFLFIFFILASRIYSYFVSDFLSNKIMEDMRLHSLVEPDNTKEELDDVVDKSTDNEKKEEEKKPEIVKVDCEKFVKEFDDNQLQAETKYEGKIIQVTGIVKNISAGLLGGYFIKLGCNKRDVLGIDIMVIFEDKDDMLDIKNGQKVTGKGVFGSQSMGSILLNDCKLVD